MYFELDGHKVNDTISQKERHKYGKVNPEMLRRVEPHELSDANQHQPGR
jgi:hypothetical protein